MKSIANKNIAADSSLDVLELRMAASWHSRTLAGKWSTYRRESTRGRRIQLQKLDKVTVRPALWSKQNPGTGVNESRDFTMSGRYRNRTCDLFHVKEAR